LRRFSPMRFAPLATARYVTDTSYRHTFDFYEKKRRNAAGEEST